MFALLRHQDAVPPSLMLNVNEASTQTSPPVPERTTSLQAPPVPPRPKKLRRAEMVTMKPKADKKWPDPAILTAVFILGISMTRVIKGMYY